MGQHSVKISQKTVFMCRILAGIVIILCLVLKAECHETDMRKELILNYEEKVAFDKFKSRVIGNVTNGFMKTDLYLLRWIRVKNLDVNRAVVDMHDCLEWRRRNRMDTILDEDWSDLAQDFPYRSDVVDLQGRPVAVGSIGGWNLRRGVMQGKQRRMTRYAYKMLEDVFNRLYHINRQHPNITQFSLILSLDGFNIFQQACPVCLATYMQLLTLYNRFYPNFAHVIIGINVPSTFSVVLDLLKPMLNKPTRDMLQVYGHNMKQWKHALDAEVSEDQLSEEFGGTRPDESE